MKKLVLLLIVILTLSNICFAAGSMTLPSPNEFLKAGKTQAAEIIPNLDKGMTAGLSPVLALLLKVGAGLAIIITLVFGIQLMTASPKKKAELKASLVPFIIGIALLALGVRIASLIIYVFTQVF